MVGKMAVQDRQSPGFRPHQDDGEITLGKCLEWSQMCMTCSVNTDSFLPSLRPESCVPLEEEKAHCSTPRGHPVTEVMGPQTSGFQPHSATHDPLFSTTGPLEHYRIPKHQDPGTLGSLPPTRSATPCAGLAGLLLHLWSALSHASCPLKHSNDRAGTH